MINEGNKTDDPTIEVEQRMMDVIELLILNPRFLKLDKFCLFRQLPYFQEERFSKFLNLDCVTIFSKLVKLHCD